MTEAERQAMQGALKPLADVWVAYLSNNLDDEARRFWGVTEKHENPNKPETIEIYAGRGGNCLINLAHCKHAFDMLTKL